MLKWTLVFLAGVLVGANAVYFVMTRDAPRPTDPLAIERAPTPADALPGGPAPAPAVEPIPAPVPGVDTTRNSPNLPAAPAVVRPGGLLVPVEGITASALSNTFTDARGNDRVHEALDIMAPRGTAVLAVADGHVEKLFDSKQGGLTLYQFDPAGRFAYYYAHLDRYAPGLVEGKRLRRGEVIGYVGSTGNANVDAPHLHFAVFVLGPEKQWWKGTPINPYPLLGGQ